MQPPRSSPMQSGRLRSVRCYLALISSPLRPSWIFCPARSDLPLSTTSAPSIVVSIAPDSWNVVSPCAVSAPMREATRSRRLGWTVA